MFMPRRRSSNTYDVKDADAALELFNPVRKAQKAESSFSAIVRTRSDVLPSVSQRQLQRKRASEVDVGFALARDEHKRKNRRIDRTGLARVLGNRSYEDDRVLLNPGERSKNDDFQKHSSASLIENEVKLQSPRVPLDSIRTDIPASKVAQAESQNGDTYTTSQEHTVNVAAAVAHPTQMRPGLDPLGAPPGFRARRPNPSNLGTFELPPPPLPSMHKYPSFNTTKQLLEEHEGSHTGGIKCAEPSCSFSRIGFKNSAGLKRHTNAFHATLETIPTLGSMAAPSTLLTIPAQQQRHQAMNNAMNAQTPAVSIRQQLLSGTYETGALGIFKETEPVLCIKYTISEDMTKDEQARNKARLSAVADRPRILGSKRSSVLGLPQGQTGIQQPPTAPAGVHALQQQSQTSQEQQSSSLPIYFHHWVPPSIQQPPTAQAGVHALQQQPQTSQEQRSSSPSIYFYHWVPPTSRVANQSMRLQY